MLTISKQQFDIGALSWRGLKASGFAGKILPGQTGADGLLAGEGYNHESRVSHSQSHRHPTVTFVFYCAARVFVLVFASARRNKEDFIRLTRYDEQGEVVRDG